MEKKLFSKISALTVGALAAGMFISTPTIVRADESKKADKAEQAHAHKDTTKAAKAEADDSDDSADDSADESCSGEDSCSGMDDDSGDATPAPTKPVTK